MNILLSDAARLINLSNNITNSAFPIITGMVATILDQPRFGSTSTSTLTSTWHAGKFSPHFTQILDYLYQQTELLRTRLHFESSSIKLCVSRIFDLFRLYVFFYAVGEHHDHTLFFEILDI